MTAQQLKNSILQMAVQGKLIPQNADDEPASVLLKRIKAEKEELIKQKKIKKEKPSAPITEEEIPFEIPESWEWCRITECGFFISGFTPKNEQLSDKGIIPYFKVSDMNTQGNELWLSITNKYYVSASKKVFMRNTIVYPKNGGAVFTNKKRILSQDSVVDLNTGGYTPSNELNLMYVFYYFSNIDFKQCYKGTALPTIDNEKLKSFIIPLPPIAEQQRIVSKIEELLPYIEAYEKAETQLTSLNTSFPEMLKKSILQYAVQGKLVPQNADDEPASVLLERIQAEKQELIKQGKIKKEKPLSPISDDEIPFDIPESWCWIKFGDVYKLTNGLASRGSKGNPMCPVLRLADLSKDIVDTSKVRELEISEKDKESHLVQKNDLILIRVNGTKDRVARAFLYKSDNSMSYCDHLFCGHALSNSISVKFIQYIFNSFFTRIQLNPEIKTTAGQNTISQESLRNIILPLPPLSEQKRIVEKIEELIPIIDGINK